MSDRVGLKNATHLIAQLALPTTLVKGKAAQTRLATADPGDKSCLVARLTHLRELAMKN